MIKSKKLSSIKYISHGFFNRLGGKSEGVYKSLNCGPGSKDKKLNVKKNLEIVKKKMNKNSGNIFILQQVHSNKVIYVDKNYDFKQKKPEADAIITNKKKLPIAILTADCAPVLICDNKKKIIAAVHVGWKGAYKGIIDKVIKLMIKKCCKLNNITAVIGPTISLENYEVKKDFYKKFLKKDKSNSKYFKKKDIKLYFDLTNYIQSVLRNNKIRNIETVNIDTFNVKNNFFSARRALKLKQDDYGRNISIIMIN